MRPHDSRPNPELWRAVHDRTAAPVSSFFVRPATGTTIALSLPHGMPADRLAMAASRQPAELHRPHRSI